MATHYETLGIDTDASPEDIRKAYKQSILRLHPDRHRKHKSHPPPNALDLNDPQLLLQASLHGTAAVMKYAAPPPPPLDPALEKALLVQFQRIQAAYDILSVPEKRRVYDKEMLADEEMSLFGERKALRETRREASRAAHPLPTPIPENATDIKPPFVWDVDRKQPLFWDPNPQPNPAPTSDETGMQLIRREDAAASSKYIFTREAAVKRLVEISDESYGAYKFIKGVSLGAVELQSKDLVPVRRTGRRRFDLAATLVTPEPVSAPPPKEAAGIPGQPNAEPPKKTDIRRGSQILKIAHAMTTADMYQARLKLEKEQALLTQIEAIKAREEAHRVQVERERQRAQLEMQMRMAMVEKQRERIRAEDELDKLRGEQAKLAAAAAQLSAQMQAWPPQGKIPQKPQRPRVNNDVGRRKEDAWQKKEVADEWGEWNTAGWGNVASAAPGADAGWDATRNGGWDNHNYHKPQHQKQESRQSHPRVNSDVGGRKENTRQKKGVADEWGEWDSAGWDNVASTAPGADAGWDATQNGGWDNPNYHKPQHQKQEGRQSHPRVKSDVGRRKENTRQKKEVADEWGEWGTANVASAAPGADAGWNATRNGGWDNPNYHKPQHEKQESRQSRPKERSANNAWVDGWGAPPPAQDIMDTGRRVRPRSRSLSVGKAETKQRARSRERADYWEQTQPEPEEKPQPRKLTKSAKVRFDMVDVPPQFRPYEPADESKGTLSGLKRLFGRA